jgi:hypothetical protein
MINGHAVLRYKIYDPYYDHTLVQRGMKHFLVMLCVSRYVVFNYEHRMQWLWPFYLFPFHSFHSHTGQNGKTYPNLGCLILLGVFLAFFSVSYKKKIPLCKINDKLNIQLYFCISCKPQLGLILYLAMSVSPHVASVLSSS